MKICLQRVFLIGFRVPRCTGIPELRLCVLIAPEAVWLGLPASFHYTGNFYYCLKKEF
jgi:hypothetical protein